MNDHITKPIDPEQLFATLQKWITPVETGLPQPGPPGMTPEVKEEDLPDSLSGFDLAAGLKRLMGNRKLYRKLLGDFGRECREAGPLLQTACTAGDLHQVDQLAHRLKGAAGNLGATQVQDAALALETLAKGAAPPSSALQTCRGALEEALATALAALEAAGLVVFDAAPDDNHPETSDILPPEVCATLAQRLREAADIGDIAGLNAIADELLPQGGAYESLSERITQLTGDFSFEGIIALADTLGHPGVSLK